MRSRNVANKAGEGAETHSRIEAPCLPWVLRNACVAIGVAVGLAIASPAARAGEADSMALLVSAVGEAVGAEITDEVGDATGGAAMAPAKPSGLAETLRRDLTDALTSGVDDAE